MKERRARITRAEVAEGFGVFLRELQAKLRRHQQLHAHLVAALVKLELPEGVPDEQLVRVRATEGPRYWRLSVVWPDDGVSGESSAPYCYVDRHTGLVLAPGENGHPSSAPSGHVLDEYHGLLYCEASSLLRNQRTALADRRAWRQLAAVQRGGGRGCEA
jgi:hypothetical protein